MDAVVTKSAPKPVGPYSQAMVEGALLFTSGQIAQDPDTGEVIEGDVRAQTHRVLENLAGVLRAAGSDLSRVLKTTVYLTDLADFSSMNAVFAEHFGLHRPARTTVQVSALPAGVAVEIDVIAAVGDPRPQAEDALQTHTP